MREERCVREIYVSRAGDPVHVGDKALTRKTPAQRGRVNRYDRFKGNTKIFRLNKNYNVTLYVCEHMLCKYIECIVSVVRVNYLPKYFNKDYIKNIRKFQIDHVENIKSTCCWFIL